MILGHMNQIDTERSIYPSAIQKGLEYIRTTDFSKMADGKYVIDGNNLFAILSTYTTQSKEMCKAETHEKYIDIQYIEHGEEIMSFGHTTDTTEISENCLAEKDALFYKSIANKKEIQMSSGMFIVFFPWDIHRCGCVSHHSATVRKVVIKVSVSAVFNEVN